MDLPLTEYSNHHVRSCVPGFPIKVATSSLCQTKKWKDYPNFFLVDKVVPFCGVQPF